MKKLISLLLISAFCISLAGCSMFEKKYSEEKYISQIEELGMEEIDMDDLDDISFDEYEDGYYFRCDYDEYIDWYNTDDGIDEFEYAIVAAVPTAFIVFYHFEDKDDASDFLETTMRQEREYLGIYGEGSSRLTDEEYVFDNANKYLLLNLENETSNGTRNNYLAHYVYGENVIIFNTVSYTKKQDKEIRNLFESFELLNPQDIEARTLNFS